MFKIALILGLIAAIFQYTEAICGVCNKNNGVACISDNEFHLCNGGQPNTSTTYRCPNPTDLCTKYGPICMDATTTKDLKPACGDISNCGKCEGVVDGGYSCTSRTTYTICLGDALSDIRLECPEYKLCDASKAALAEYPCVAQCEEDNISVCDLQDAIDAPVTTTTTTEVPTTTTTADNPTTITVTTSESTTSASTVTTTEEDDLTTTTIFAPTPTTQPTTSSPITTESTATMTTTTSEPTTTEIPTTQPTTTTEIPTTTVNPAEVLCSQQTAVGRYPYPNDNTCRRYVNCYMRNGVMQSTVMPCPGQTYFDASTTLCAEPKPQGCI